MDQRTFTSTRQIERQRTPLKTTPLIHTKTKNLVQLQKRKMKGPGGRLSRARVSWHRNGWVPTLQRAKRMPVNGTENPFGKSTLQIHGFTRLEASVIRMILAVEHRQQVTDRLAWLTLICSTGLLGP